MPASRIQMHLHGNPSLLQPKAINERLFNTVHVVILRLYQKRTMSSDVISRCWVGGKAQFVSWFCLWRHGFHKRPGLRNTWGL